MSDREPEWTDWGPEEHLADLQLDSIDEPEPDEDSEIPDDPQQMDADDHLAQIRKDNR